MSRGAPQAEVVGAVEIAIGNIPRGSANPIRVTFLPPDTVALVGEVETADEKEEIGRHAAAAAKGCRIENDLTVSVNRPDTDASLTRQAAERLAQEGLATIGVQVRGGVAHLMGTADSLAVVDRARWAVGAIPAIGAVQSDHVAVAKEQVAEVVAPPPLPTASETAIVADIDEAEIVDRVESLLASAWDPPPAGGVRAYASHQTVVLEGMVKTAARRAEAERLARSVPGVAHVRNLLVCQDGSAGWNEHIEAEIRHRLGRRRDHASPVDIKVFVAAGSVFLFGTADFPEQLDEARAIVREVAGDLPVYPDVKFSSRHPRPSTGAGHAVEDARE